MNKPVGRPYQRRAFLKACAAAAAVTGTVLSASCADTSENFRKLKLSAPAGTPQATAATHWVDPRIGTGWHGHTFPGATAPFGLVQLSPDSSGPPEPKWNGWYGLYGWDHCSGYHYSDNVINGFSHTHLSGTGAVDLGDVLMMPMVEGANWGWDPHPPGKEHESQIAALGHDAGWVSAHAAQGYASRFSHRQEVVRAGYYSVFLETPRVKAELTATTRCGMHRYTYPAVPATIRQGVILDLVHGLGSKPYHATLHIESSSRISGTRFTHGWAANKQVYFVIEFAQPFAAVQVKLDGKIRTGGVGKRFAGQHIQAIFSHAPQNGPLVARVGISCTGIAGARKNLATEIPHWNFDAVRRQTHRAWSTGLSALDAQFPGNALAPAFYTGLYHAMVAPATFNDVDGTYRGEDHKNHPSPGFTNYTTLSIWDIFRAQFPLMMLAAPQRTNDVINTLLTAYRQLNAHSLAVWPLWGNETWCMDGFHVASMILGAYTRGFRGFDAPAAYAAMRDTALVGDAFTGRKRVQEVFRDKGYVPSGPRKSAVSATLDLAYGYWCVGAMAQLLGHHEDAKMFYKLGANYKNLFDPETGFMRSKTGDGKWREPFRPDREYWSDYTESDAWQATFNVLQDVPGLITLYGGDHPFIAKLDKLFTAPSKTVNSPPDISGMIGQDAQANEPSNHIPYLYTFAGAAWKTQYWVRKMLALYNNAPNGIPGNDDCGQTSSCFVLGALGFYPVNPATGVYVIGSPLVRRARIRSSVRGAIFNIVAENNSSENLYIQRANLNGKELSRSWFTHADIVAGGELHFYMGNIPNKDWAAAQADRPPSGLI